MKNEKLGVKNKCEEYRVINFMGCKCENISRLFIKSRSLEENMRKNLGGLEYEV